MNGTGIRMRRNIFLLAIMICLVFAGCQKAPVQQAEVQPVGSHPNGAAASSAASPEDQSDKPTDGSAGSQGAAPGADGAGSQPVEPGEDGVGSQPVAPGEDGAGSQPIEPGKALQDGEEEAIADNNTGTDQEGLLRNTDSLIPDGWQPGTDAYGHPAVAIGYLDGDSISDVVLVVERDGNAEGSAEDGTAGSDDSEDVPKTDGSEDVSQTAGSDDEVEADVLPDGARIRKLIIALGCEDGSYRQEAVFDDLILSSDSGGVWGDPFDGLSFDQRKKEIIINHYGGSNWRWYTVDTLKETDGEWRVAKRVEGSYFTGDRTVEEADETTYDYLAGTYTKRTFDENLDAVFEEGKIEVSAPHDNNG